jgi:hypothetical protein
VGVVDALLQGLFPFTLYSPNELAKCSDEMLEGSIVFCGSLSRSILLVYNLSVGPWVLAEYFGMDRLFSSVITSAYRGAGSWSMGYDGHSVNVCSVLNLVLISLQWLSKLIDTCHV